MCVFPCKTIIKYIHTCKEQGHTYIYTRYVVEELRHCSNMRPPKTNCIFALPYLKYKLLKYLGQKKLLSKL